MDAKIGARKNDSTSGLVQQDESLIHAKKSLVHIPVGNKRDGDRVEPSDASAHYGSEMGDDPYDAFYMTNQPNPNMLPDPTTDRLCALEKKIKVIEGNNIFGVAAINMHLVSNLVIPAKFKTPDFEKCTSGKWLPTPKMTSYLYTISKTV